MSEKLNLNWSKSHDGLLPAIIQDAQTHQVLMMGYINEASLAQTIESKKVTFFSRTRQSIWVKGETSGNFFHVVSLKPDCDQDALLIQVNPEGPACHRDTQTCFDAEPNGFEFLSKLEATVQDRIKNPSTGSYTSSLIHDGLDRVAQKVGEEAVETVIASKNSDLKNLEGEAADLVFHLMVLLNLKMTSFKEVVSVLKKRHSSR